MINDDEDEEVTEGKSLRMPIRKQGKVLAEPGHPLKFAEVADVDAPDLTGSSVFTTIGETLAAYKKAAHKLLEGKYAAQRELAPPHMRGPTNIFVIRCTDGIFVRYDLVSEGEAKIRCAKLEKGLAEVAPQLSDQVIHFPQDPHTYVPSGGPEIVLATGDVTSGTTAVQARVRLLVYATTTLPSGFEMPLPPARPPCLIGLQNELDLQMHGIIVPSDAPVELAGPDTQQFIAHGRLKLPVGWQTIEIYPPLGDEFWKPEYAPTWAELDLQAAIVQRNAVAAALSGLDSRRATRKYYAALLEEFDRLLAGPEEPVHQFLKQHPELLCPTAERFWSKLPFGDRFSDFVFRGSGLLSIPK
jgi:hypothetical protein